MTAWGVLQDSLSREKLKTVGSEDPHGFHTNNSCGKVPPFYNKIGSINGSQTFISMSCFQIAHPMFSVNHGIMMTKLRSRWLANY